MEIHEAYDYDPARCRRALVRLLTHVRPPLPGESRDLTGEPRTVTRLVTREAA